MHKRRELISLSCREESDFQSSEDCSTAYSFFPIIYKHISPIVTSAAIILFLGKFWNGSLHKPGRKNVVFAAYALGSVLYYINGIELQSYPERSVFIYPVNLLQA